MTTQGPVSLESLKLRLISNPAISSSSDPLLTRDGIFYLLKALAYADSAFSAEIENVLVKAGGLAISELIKALASDNLNVRSVSTMALIRIGQPAEAFLTQSYLKASRKPSLRWIYEFIFQELGTEIPVVSSLPKTNLHKLQRAI